MDVGARLVEVMAGMRYDEYLRTTVFEPLGMVDTGFFVPEGDLDRFAACYGRNTRKALVLVADPERSSYQREPKPRNGGGGRAGPPGDTLPFVAVLANARDV